MTGDICIHNGPRLSDSTIPVSNSELVNWKARLDENAKKAIRAIEWNSLHARSTHLIVR